MFKSQNFCSLTGFQGFLHKHSGISRGLRENSSNANIPKTRIFTGGRAKDGNYDIITLDPTKFAEKKQKRLTIANSYSFTPHVLLNTKSRYISRPLRYQFTMQTGKTVHIPFPPAANAFLYYTTCPENPRIAGELRFRITSSDDPKSFASGSDLFWNDLRWSRPVSVLPKHYPLLYEKLREELLVPDALDAVLSALPKRKSTMRRQILYSLYDTFTLDFAKYSSTLSIITEKGVESLKFCEQFWDNRGMCKVKPYTGTALARFERSQFPEHEGTRTIVLRFFKIIKPVQCVVPSYDGYIVPPKEGDLFRRYFKTSTFTSDSPAWSVNIDQSKKSAVSRALRLLWDA